MKRSDALAPLSRDHHVALEAALWLRRADEATVTGAVENFMRFWTARGSGHFEAEEAVLLPALPEGEADWDAAAQRVRSEHATIRERAAALSSARPPDRVQAARELGTLLHEHVRFEERVLFELLEARLAGDELARLGDALAAREAEG